MITFLSSSQITIIRKQGLNETKRADNDCIEEIEEWNLGYQYRRTLYHRFHSSPLCSTPRIHTLLSKWQSFSNSVPSKNPFPAVNPSKNSECESSELNPLVHAPTLRHKVNRISPSRLQSNYLNKMLQMLWTCLKLWILWILWVWILWI